MRKWGSNWILQYEKKVYYKWVRILIEKWVLNMLLFILKKFPQLCLTYFINNNNIE